MTAASTSLARLVEDWPGWGGLFADTRFPEVLRALDADRIRVEEYRDDGSVVVRAELPGLDPDKDIDVTVTDGVLRIHAQREEREEAKEEGRYRSEFHYGSFTRRVPLPEGTSQDAIEATYRDGILEVRFPFVEQPASKAIEVPVTRP
jgi:HSP20 family protein